MRWYVRLVDRICVVGSKIPMEIWTIDIFNFEVADFLKPEIGDDGVQKSIDWTSNQDLLDMRQGMDPTWRPTYDEGVVAYLEGDWDRARSTLLKAQNLNPSDGPTKSLLKQMEARDNICPKDWKREGEQRGFRQLTSK